MERFNPAACRAIVLHPVVGRGEQETAAWVGGVGWGPHSGMCSWSQGEVLGNSPFSCISQHQHSLFAPQSRNKRKELFPSGNPETIYYCTFLEKVNIIFLGARKQSRPHINPCASSSHCPLPEKLHRQKLSWCYLTWSITTSSVVSL